MLLCVGESGRVERNTREKERVCIVKLVVFIFASVSFCSWNKTLCFIPSECFKATTSGSSHQQLVSEPRSLENRSIFWDSRIFKVVKNKFWSFHCVELIHTNSLPQKSAQSDTGVSHTSLLNIRNCLPTRSHAPRGRRRLSHTRAIFEPFKPSRVEP